MRANTHCGTESTQVLSTSAAAVASTGMTVTQNHQYSQPIVKPAHGPIERSAYVENDPVSGCRIAISPSIRITSTTSIPASRYEISTAGPAVAIAVPDPTKMPAPITPAIEIIVM